MSGMGTSIPGTSTPWGYMSIGLMSGMGTSTPCTNTPWCSICQI